MHRNSSPKLQTQYPRETIPDRKPLGQRPRERSSEIRGGLSLRVRELVQKGITDPTQIRNTLDISTQALASRRKVLRGWGIDIPQTIKSNIQEAFERIKTENDDKKLQEFLDSFSDNSLKGFLARNSSHETLTTLSAIGNEKGFRVYTKRVRFVAEKIKTAGIPVRRIEHIDKNGKLLGSYYVVYAKHADRIARVLNSDQDLQRFK